MSCALCGGPLLKGTYWVEVKAFVTLNDGHGRRVAEKLVMEDGAPSKVAHYGCILKRCPELIGALNGSMRT